MGSRRPPRRDLVGMEVREGWVADGQLRPCRSVHPTLLDTHFFPSAVLFLAK